MIEKSHNFDQNLYKSVEQIIIEAKSTVYRSTNTIVLKMYWEIGKLIVKDESTLNSILDLGFERNDLQSLFVLENIEYLTSYSVYFTEHQVKAPEYKNKEQAINLVKKICSERGFNISQKSLIVLILVSLEQCLINFNNR